MPKIYFIILGMIFILLNLNFNYNEEIIKKLPVTFEDGYPILPYDFKVIEIPNNVKSVKIKNLRIQRKLYKSNVILQYNDKIYYFDNNQNLKIINIPRIEIGNKFPKEIIEVKSIGYYRDKKLATIFIYPITYENGNLYLNESISFDLEYEQSQTTYNLKPLPDSLDYLILTISLFKEPFDSIAKLSIIRGFRTLVVYIDSIKDNPQKIRDLIIWAYRTFGIKYVLIGADASIIKTWRFQVSYYDADPNLPTGPDIHTDYPYSALDGDYINGKKWKIGDSLIDPYADIGIGRLPITNVYEAYNYYYKLRDWTFNFNGNPNAFACLESEIMYSYFGGYCENIVSVSNMPRIIRLYEPNFNGNLTPQILFDSLNINKPQFFFYIGHANGFIIASSYASPTYYVGFNEFYNMNFNYSAPYIAMFGGCWTGDLEHTALIKQILLMPDRGAIFGIGASKLDNTGSETSRGMAFFLAFNNYNAKTIGDAYIYMVMNFSGSLFNTYSKLNMFGDPTIEPYLNGKNYINANFDNSFSDSLVVNTIPNARVLLYDGENYTLTISDNSGKAILRYSSGSNKTLLLSISKPSHIPYYSYVNYYPSNVVLDSIILNADHLIPSNSYQINFYLKNLSSNNQSINFKIKLNNANPDSIFGNLNFNPNEEKTLSYNITIKPNAKNLIGKFYINDKLIRSFSYSVEKITLRLVGVKWESDSIDLDIFNNSKVNIYNVELKLPDFGISKIIDSIISKSTTNYTTKLPRVSNNPKLIVSYAGKQDTYQLNFQLPLPSSDNFYLLPQREGILIKFDTTDNNARFYKIYRSENPNGNYKFAGITNDFAKSYIDYIDSFKVYYYKISRIDFYYNEGEISNYKYQSKNPDYSIYKPTYLPNQGESPPLILNDSFILIFSPIYMSFYNNKGITINGYPKDLKFHAYSGAVADIDGDGIEEAIISARKDNNSFLLLVNINEIDTLFYSNFFGDISIYNKGLIIANFANDSLPEIALKTYYSDSNNKQRIIILDPRTKAIINQIKLFSGNVSTNWDISASDFDNDGLYEIVSLDSLGKLHILKANGQEIDNFPIDLMPYLPYNNPNAISYFSSAIYVTYNKVICGIIQSGNLRIFIINVNNGIIENVINVNSYVNNNPIEPFSLSLGDIDNDGFAEIILITYHGYYPSKRILIFKLNGNLLSQYIGPDVDWGWPSPATIVDILNDNKMDLVLSLPRRVFILTYDNGNLNHFIGTPIILADDTLPEGYPFYSPIFKDINNDNKPEMFILQWSNPLYSFNLGDIGKIEWNGNRANFKNTAEYGEKISNKNETNLNFVKFNYKKFAIEFNLESSESYNLKIYDVLGRVVYKNSGFIKGKGLLTINSKLARGIYIIDFKSKNYNFKIKALKLN